MNSFLRFFCCIIVVNVAWGNTYWNQSYPTTRYYDNSQSYYDEQYNLQADYETAYNLYKKGMFDRALPLFAKLCDLNNYIACLSAGIVQGKMIDSLDNDRRFSRSERKRKKQEYFTSMMAFYTKSCNGGNYDACNNLAFYQYSTKEQLQKEEQAAKQEQQQSKRTMELYAKSCKAGNKEACLNLGALYSENLDDKNAQNINLNQAQNYYGKSCDMGDNVACFNLGVLRYNYAKTASDYAQAIRFFNQSCGNDYPAACLNLGIIYERGVTQDSNDDVANALQYYTKACSLKNADACSYLSRLANKRTKIK